MRDIRPGAKFLPVRVNSVGSHPACATLGIWGIWYNP